MFIWDFVRDVAGLVNSIQEKCIPLSGLFSAVEASVGVNLAYSILFKLDKFTGGLIAVWATRERVRVMAVLSENDKFNASRFQGDLAKISRRFERTSYCISSLSVLWALIAVLAAAILLVVAPFYDHRVRGEEALYWSILFFGAVPLGLTISGIVHLFSRGFMWNNSREYNVLIKYAQPPEPPKVAVQSALSKMKLRNKSRAR